MKLSEEDEGNFRKWLYSIVPTASQADPDLLISFLVEYVKENSGRLNDKFWFKKNLYEILVGIVDDATTFGDELFEYLLNTPSQIAWQNLEGVLIEKQGSQLINNIYGTASNETAYVSSMGPNSNEERDEDDIKDANELYPNWLLVKNVPSTSFQISDICKVFAEFGSITTCLLESSEGNSAVIKFARFQDAEKCYNSTIAFFNNRFVQIYRLENDTIDKYSLGNEIIRVTKDNGTNIASLGYTEDSDRLTTDILPISMKYDDELVNCFFKRYKRYDGSESEHIDTAYLKKFDSKDISYVDDVIANIDKLLDKKSIQVKEVKRSIDNLKSNLQFIKYSGNEPPDLMDIVQRAFSGVIKHMNMYQLRPDVMFKLQYKLKTLLQYRRRRYLKEKVNSKN